MKFMINGAKWTVKVLADERFNKEHGKSTLAVTILEERQIVFRKGDFDLNYIRHELYHCYHYTAYASTYGGSLDLKPDQCEELSASIVGLYGKELVQLSEKVYAWLNSKKEK